MNAPQAATAVSNDPKGAGTFAATDAAEYLGVAYSTLAIWRCLGRYSLPYIKVGRLVRYRKSDLDAFLAARTVACAKEAA